MYRPQPHKIARGGAVRAGDRQSLTGGCVVQPGNQRVVTGRQIVGQRKAAAIGHGLAGGPACRWRVPAARDAILLRNEAAVGRDELHKAAQIAGRAVGNPVQLSRDGAPGANRVAAQPGAQQADLIAHAGAHVQRLQPRGGHEQRQPGVVQPAIIRLERLARQPRLDPVGRIGRGQAHGHQPEASV